ncbi:BREX-2 system phosphatase PglZ [Actinomadura oligospora]|uniref:BREX-2 system phosphatase PglZ n=1 Tax=Actinomadura oligospora TaxID=111804 RepID=UPI00047891CA|nr:BREX-2 system phosphatase PglZ [Actinomadura oligospora]
MSTPPLVDRRVLEALLSLELPARGNEAGPAGPRLVLVHGRYQPGTASEFTITIGDRQQRVRVSDQPSVLGIIDAWERHCGTPADSAPLLVITTGVDARELGADLRGHALARRPLNVDRAEIVKQRFGAARLDPRIRAEEWLVDALLDAEPSGGWRTHPAAAAWRRSGGALLTHDAALHALVETRLEITTGRSGSSGELDIDTLLAWSRQPGATDRFAALGPDERHGIAAWLQRTSGPAVAVLLGLAGAGRGEDAMALGIIAGPLDDPASPPAATLAIGRLFADVTAGIEELRMFTVAVQGILARWIAEAESSPDRTGEARDRVEAVLGRADRLAASAGLAPGGATPVDNAFLPSGLRSRIQDFAAVLSGRVESAQETLARVVEHRLSGLRPDSVEVARMALRVRRWLDRSDVPDARSVADGVADYLADGAWLDRALTVLWSGSSDLDSTVGRAYRRLYERARTRRTELDQRFADRLASWAPGAAVEAPGGALLVESVLAEVVVPVAASGGAPLVIVLDGMSGPVAVQLGEELARGGRWAEVTSRSGRRSAAVAMIPSVTRISRASLLSGEPAEGGQAVEVAGFERFWKRHRRSGLVFHKAQVPGPAGQRLSDDLAVALAEDHVVAVVLNTIDDALDHGKEGDRAGWRLKDISYLPDLLNAALDFGRPVVLVADHGHVLEREESAPGTPRVTSTEIGAARWRTGTPGEGEVELAGPRVLENGGRVVVPWREEIRYTPRKAGYHGGASLAEMAVPVLVLLPDAADRPKGWELLPPEETEPAWWTGREASEKPVPVQVPSSSQVLKTTRARKRMEEPEGEALFSVGEAAPSAPPAEPVPATLGAVVTASAVYSEQRRYLRKPPPANQVAAVVDALATAGERLSVAAVAAAAAAAGGRAPRSPELFVTALQRLLNVEGYPVLDLIDSGRTVQLNVATLREQFGVGSSQ